MLPKGHQAFLELAHELHVSAEIPLSLILAQRNVLQESASEEQGDLLPLVLQAVGQALAGLDGMRLREGEALQADLKVRRTDSGHFSVAQVRERAPQVVEEIREAAATVGEVAWRDRA